VVFFKNFVAKIIFTFELFNVYFMLISFGWRLVTVSMKKQYEVYFEYFRTTFLKLLLLPRALSIRLLSISFLYAA